MIINNQDTRSCAGNTMHKIMQLQVSITFQLMSIPNIKLGNNVISETLNMAWLLEPNRPVENISETADHSSAMVQQTKNIQVMLREIKQDCFELTKSI